LEEKNYEKAEVLFKKVCLSEPEHHSGFEGLARAGLHIIRTGKKES